MKKTFIFLFTLVYLQSIKSQSSNTYPESIFDVGAGVGTNHGIIGVQTVTGYKGTGLLLAAGYFAGVPTYQVGVKLSYKWLFTSVSYGTYSILENTGTGEVVGLNGTILLGGVKLNLLKSKKLYFELGAGWVIGEGILTPFGIIPDDGPTASLGVGYRIAFKKKLIKKREADK